MLKMDRFQNTTTNDDEELHSYTTVQMHTVREIAISTSTPSEIHPRLLLSGSFISRIPTITRLSRFFCLLFLKCFRVPAIQRSKHMELRKEGGNPTADKRKPRKYEPLSALFRGQSVFFAFSIFVPGLCPFTIFLSLIATCSQS